MTQKPEYTEGSGNVFQDLGLPDAGDLKVKAALVMEIGRKIEERGFTQTQAAEILGVDQPKVSALVRGHLAGFSQERLCKFLNALGTHIQIVLRDGSGIPSPASVRVVRDRRVPS